MGMQGRKNPNAGRKEKEIDLKKVEELASRGLNQTQIATCLDIHKSTFHNKKRKLKEFSDALERGRQTGIMCISNALFENAMDGHFPAQKFYLCNRDRDNWQEKPEIENNVNTTIIQHLDIEKDL